MKTILIISAILFTSAGCASTNPNYEVKTDLPVADINLKDVNPKFYEIKVCPFYVPDGVSYRNCLSNLIEQRKAGVPVSVYEQSSDSCAKEAKEYEGFITEQNLYLSCLASSFAEDR